MKTFSLVLVTKNQNTKEKAKKIASLVCELLDINVQQRDINVKITVYDKFPHAYRIEIVGHIPESQNVIAESVILTQKICSPWHVTLVANQPEMIFNRTSHSKYSKPAFNVIDWAAFNIIEAI